MLTRLPSVSKNDTYRPTLGISMGSPSTSPPASVTRLIAASMSSTETTTDGCCAVGVAQDVELAHRVHAEQLLAGASRRHVVFSRSCVFNPIHQEQILLR